MILMIGAAKAVSSIPEGPLPPEGGFWGVARGLSTSLDTKAPSGAAVSVQPKYLRASAFAQDLFLLESGP